MPVTLAQASLNAASDIDRRVIDEFRKSSFLLDRLPFDPVVNPAGGGSTLVYGYTRQITQRAAAFRAFNTEYPPVEVDKAPFTVNLRPLGGAFQIDRVLADIGAVSEVAFQLDQVVKAARAFFSEQVINGDTAVTPDGFDGLSKALANSSTEIGGGPVLDFTTVNDQITALRIVQRINAWLGRMDGPASALLMNSTAASWFSLIAALSGQLRSTNDAFGQPISTFRDIPIVDLGARAGSSADVVATYSGTSEVQTITITGTPTGGTFTLAFAGQTTAPIAHNASAANVVTALEALDNINPGDVTASGGALPGVAVAVTFTGRFAGINVAQMTAVGALTGGTAPTVAVTTTTPGGTGVGTGASGLTDIYAVRLGLDGFHGVSVTGPLVRQWLPDFNTAGAVKTGEVEMGPVAVALKATKAAAVYRNVKVA